MKRKVNISIFAVVALLLSVVVVFYFFLYMMPAKQSQMVIQAETKLFQAKAQLIEPYLEDHTPLEQEIADIQAVIDDLHANAYTNEATVNTVIAKAITRYQIELTSLTLGETIDYDEAHRALPINMAFRGSQQDVLDFIDFFESNMDGSYLIRNTNITFNNGESCTVTLAMYLCAPSV